jgi:acetyl-CoA acetyltransferase
MDRSLTGGGSRTPVGSFNGAFATTPAHDLGAIGIKAALERAGLEPGGTSDLISYYPDTVRDWIRRNGGLSNEMKKIRNGEELWKIVDPCPDEW